MAYNKAKLLAGLDSIAQSEKAAETTSPLTDLMVDPAYLRHSSSLINEALQKGFDVLQLANGDIVTTGTKTIVNTYVWDASSAHLVKAKTPANKAKRRASKGEMIEEDLS